MLWAWMLTWTREGNLNLQRCPPWSAVSFSIWGFGVFVSFYLATSGNPWLLMTSCWNVGKWTQTSKMQACAQCTEFSSPSPSWISAKKHIYFSLLCLCHESYLFNISKAGAKMIEVKVNRKLSLVSNYLYRTHTQDSRRMCLYLLGDFPNGAQDTWGPHWQFGLFFVFFFSQWQFETSQAICAVQRPKDTILPT